MSWTCNFYQWVLYIENATYYAHKLLTYDVGAHDNNVTNEYDVKHQHQHQHQHQHPSQHQSKKSNCAYLSSQIERA